MPSFHHLIPQLIEILFFTPGGNRKDSMDSESGEQTTFSKHTPSTSYEHSLESSKTDTEHQLTLASMLPGNATEQRSK